MPGLGVRHSKLQGCKAKYPTEFLELQVATEVGVLQGSGAEQSRLSGKLAAD
jgi:hypothetical protein